MSAQGFSIAVRPCLAVHDPPLAVQGDPIGVAAPPVGAIGLATCVDQTRRSEEADCTARDLSQPMSIRGFTARVGPGSHLARDPSVAFGFLGPPARGPVGRGAV